MLETYTLPCTGDVHTDYNKILVLAKKLLATYEVVAIKRYIDERYIATFYITRTS